MKSTPIYIKNLKLKNIRTFGEVELNFESTDGTLPQWTIILGDNGIGKSTLLHCIAWMSPYLPYKRDQLPEHFVPAPMINDEENELLIRLVRKKGSRFDEISYLNATFQSNKELGESNVVDENDLCETYIEIALDADGELDHVDPKLTFKSIKYLAGDNKHLYKLKHPVGKITVYPIIIYTEQHMEKHGVNDYVNQKFLKIIANYDSPFYDIKPLVMIHYDFFVENAILLEKHPRLLKDAIKEYLSFVNRKKATYKKTEHNLDYYKSMVSFDKFIIGFQKLYTMEQMSIFKNTARIFKLKGS